MRAERTEELKNKLAATFSNKANWNKHIDIDGETYIYISCKNEIRQRIHQTGGDIAILVGCFAFGRFMWC